MIPFKSASTILATVAFGALVVAAPIAAQPAPQGRMGPGANGHQMPQQMPGGMMGMMGHEMMGMADHVEGRIAFLKTELKITETQMPQWTAFADTLRANAKRMSEMRNSMMQGGMMQGGRAG